MQRCDVVVVGAGAMGAAAAWWLARRGRDVVLLEQFEQGHVRGSSHGGARIFRFAYPDPSYVAMAMEALPLWRELEDEAGRELVVTTGGIDHGDQAVVGAVEAALAAGGASSQRLSAAAAHDRWPGMRFDGDVLFQPDAGRCLADAAVSALQERARALGADVRFGAAADVELVGDGGVDGVTVHAGDESWRARVAVVTAGAWVDKVVRGRVALPPLRVTREQVQHFAPTGEGWPSFIHHADPVHYGLLTPAEGIKVGAHHTGPEVDPDRRTFELDGDELAAMSAYVREWLPGVDPTPVHATTCLYTTTPTEAFVLERVGPLVVGSACSGHGFKFTPLIGRRLADLAGVGL